MKKLFLSLFIFLLLFSLSACGKKEEEEEAKEPTTLTEYMTSLNKDVSQYEFKCEAVKNNNIIYFDYSYNESKLFLGNGEVYDVVLGNKTFSNGEQCKLNENFPKVSKVVPMSYEKYIVTSEGDVCKYSSTRSGDKTEDIVECNLVNSQSSVSKRNALLLKSGNVTNVMGTTYDSGYNNKTYYHNYIYYHLNHDNKIYKTTMNEKGKVLSKEEIYTIPNYGYINYISATIDASTNSVELKKLITNMGYYELKEIATEECSKYVDVECEKKFVKNELLDKYWNSVKYASDGYIFTHDNHIYNLYSLSK